jgi:TPR repeat protein
MAQLAATGHAEGLFRASLKMANGMGVAKDFDTSLKYMQAAASLGHAKAVRKLPAGGGESCLPHAVVAGALASTGLFPSV